MDEAARPLGLREAQKAETRARVLEAARQLFVDVGYEAATIRSIAKRAGVAPGSVFTTFASKAEVLMEIIFARYAAAAEEVRAAAHSADGGPRERLLAAAKISYIVELREPRLLAEALSASWVWSGDAERESRRRLSPLVEVIRATVSNAVGDNQHEIVDMVSDMIFDCYLRNYRKAFFDGWSVEQLMQLLERQLDLILASRKLPCTTAEGSATGLDRAATAG